MYPTEPDEHILTHFVCLSSFSFQNSSPHHFAGFFQKFQKFDSLTNFDLIRGCIPTFPSGKTNLFRDFLRDSRDQTECTTDPVKITLYFFCGPVDSFRVQVFLTDATDTSRWGIHIEIEFCLTGFFQQINCISNSHLFSPSGIVFFIRIFYIEEFSCQGQS